MASKDLKLTIKVENLDEVIEKVNQLKELIAEVHKSIDSLSVEVKTC